MNENTNKCKCKLNHSKYKREAEKGTRGRQRNVQAPGNNLEYSNCNYHFDKHTHLKDRTNPIAFWSPKHRLSSAKSARHQQATPTVEGKGGGSKLPWLGSNIRRQTIVYASLTRGVIDSLGQKF
jgi:hypothetical protein